MVELPLWQAVAMVNFPRAVMPAEPTPAGELPKQFVPASRIPARQRLTSGGIEVVLTSWPDSAAFVESTGVQFDPAAVALRVAQLSTEEALDAISPVLEAICESLALQLNASVHVVQLELMDVTPPISVGDERRILLYPFPGGYSMPKFAISMSLGDIRVAMQPTLNDTVLSLSRMVRSALRWYVKSLDIPYDADKFMHLWVALEILCIESGLAVHKPYKAPCGHDIDRCPICERPTQIRVNGPTIQEYLAAHLGVDNKVARELWQMRQMFHGRLDLTRDAVKELPRLLMELRGAVVIALKPHLGLEATDPPLVVAGVPSISQNFSLEGSRIVVETDLAYF